MERHFYAEKGLSPENLDLFRERENIVGTILSDRIEILEERYGWSTVNEPQEVISLGKEAVTAWDIDPKFFWGENKIISSYLFIAILDEYLSAQDKTQRLQGIRDFGKLLIAPHSKVLSRLATSEKPLRSAYEFVDSLPHSQPYRKEVESLAFEKNEVDENRTQQLREVIALQDERSPLYLVNKRLDTFISGRNEAVFYVMSKRADELASRFSGAIAWVKGRNVYLPIDWEVYPSLAEHEYLHTQFRDFSFGSYNSICRAMKEAWIDYHTSDSKSHRRRVLESIFQHYPEMEAIFQENSNPRTNGSVDRVLDAVLRRYGLKGLLAFGRMGSRFHVDIDSETFYHERMVYISPRKALENFNDQYSSDKPTEKREGQTVLEQRELLIKHGELLLAYLQKQYTSEEKKYYQENLTSMAQELVLLKISHMDRYGQQVLKSALEQYGKENMILEFLNSSDLLIIQELCFSLSEEDQKIAAKVYVDFFSENDFKELIGFSLDSLNLYTKLQLFERISFNPTSENEKSFLRTVCSYALQKHPEEYLIAFQQLEYGLTWFAASDTKAIVDIQSGWEASMRFFTLNSKYIEDYYIITSFLAIVEKKELLDLPNDVIETIYRSLENTLQAILHTDYGEEEMTSSVHQKSLAILLSFQEHDK